MSHGKHFDRWDSWWDITWPLRRFRQHHTELNQFYWAAVVAGQYAERSSKSAAPGDSTVTHFGFSSPDGNRVPRTIAQWVTRFREYSNWTRLSAAMALASCLEMYIQATVTLAVESDPGVLIRAPRKVDGVSLLKAGADYGQRDAALPIVKGTWQARIGHYRKLFGVVPRVLQDSLPELERLRQFRNSVGHAFGRDLDAGTPLVELEAAPLQSLSEDRLKKWLGLTASVVGAVDRHLRVVHIGAYEVIRLYHDWPGRRRLVQHDQPRALKKAIGAGCGSDLPSSHYLREALSYYHKLPGV